MKQLAALLVLVAAPASAEVVSASANGFEVRETVALVVPPDVAFRAFGDLPAWWDPEHTYSGDPGTCAWSWSPAAASASASRRPAAGSSTCTSRSSIPASDVMTGPLGPLLYEATTGVMDVRVTTIAGGSQLTLDYKVAGFANGGADKLASAVDAVLARTVETIPHLRDEQTAHLVALQRDEPERRIFARMVLAECLAPARGFPRVGHEGVALDFRQHLGQLETIGERKEQGEDVGPADDRNRLSSRERGSRLRPNARLRRLRPAIRDRESARHGGGPEADRAGCRRSCVP